MGEYVYLDYAASAPLRPEAVAAEEAYRALPCAGANPNSLHTLGRQAAGELEKARRAIARALRGGFRPADIVFTGGGTEADNLAVIGMAEGAREKDRKRTRVVLSAIEHDAVLDLVAPLKQRGFSVDPVAPGRDGRVSCEALEELLGPDVALVSVMAANNETGAVQPVAQLGAAAHKAGALFHVDAIQAFGRVPLDLANGDAVSVAGHKIGAPVGTAFLALRSRAPFWPQAFGGGQERGVRPGTQDVAGAVALAAAVQAVCGPLDETRAAVAGRANRLQRRLCSVEGVEASLDLPWEDRLPGIVSVLVEGLESEGLVLALDQAGFEVSAGSACSSGSLEPSHVLTAMGIPRDRAFGSLRISFDERVPEEDLERFSEAFAKVVPALRSRERL